jgi:hypothetical protein
MEYWTVDKENRVLEFLNKEIMKRIQAENEGEKVASSVPINE